LIVKARFKRSKEMSNDKKYKLIATVIDAKGQCDAGHKLGDTFELSIMKTSGLCGGFYHDMFPAISTYEFGGTYPWHEEGIFYAGCPDIKNQITLKVERIPVE